MTRKDAEAKAAALNRDHPQRAEFQWFAKQDGDGEWSVARVRLPHRRSAGSPVGSQPPKPSTPPENHPLDLPGGLPPWSVGG